MSEEETFKTNLNRVDTRIACIYILILCSILYLILYSKDKATLIDNFLGTDYSSKYPDTQHYPKIIIILLLIVNSIFLYLSYIILKEKEKTGNTTSFDSYHLSYYTNLIQIAATLISVYNVFINEAQNVNITR